MSDTDFSSQLRVLAKALRHETFRLVIIEYNNTDIYNEIAAFLRTTYPERPQQEVRFIGNDYRAIMDSLIAAEESFMLIPDFDRIFDDNNAALCIAFNQRRDYFANRNMALLCFIAPENFLLFPKRLPDLWSLRSLELTFFREPTLISSNRKSLETSTTPTPQSSFGGNTQESKEREIARLLRQIDISEEMNLALRYSLITQLCDLYLDLRRADQAVEQAEVALRLAQKLNDSERIAASFFNLGRGFIQKNDFTQGIAAYNEALSIRRELAKASPDAYLPIVASILNNLGLIYQEINEFNRAEQAYTEALTIKQNLAQNNSDAYLPSVVSTLNNLGVLYKSINLLGKAEEALSEALSISRKLAKLNFTRYINDVASTLTNLGDLFTNINQLNKAEEVLTEALSIRRELTKTNPDKYLPEIAITLHNLGNLYCDTNQLSKGEQAFSEALSIRRELATTNPDAYLPRIASTLNNLGNVLKDINQLDKAEQAYSESLSIRRELAQSYPRAYLPKVAQIAANFSHFYQQYQPNQELSILLAREALMAALPFKEELPSVQINITNAKSVLTSWGLDADAFVEDIRKEKAHPPTLPQSPETA